MPVAMGESGQQVPAPTAGGARAAQRFAVHSNDPEFVRRPGAQRGPGAVLGQLDVALKTNEMPMFAALLDSIDLLGALVTADALHCQKDHAKYLVEKRGAHYLLTVKGNQPTLRRQLAALPWADLPITHTQHDRGHGRVEKRTLKVVVVQRVQQWHGCWDKQYLGMG